ncbi:MAG TPA: copper chaperone PCu(A)C [Thermoanaerobaculia bacterium]|jgi:copper(I)-binding protein|nr:copper chaperone PCu(A)C [Thermoanaerobaculia bacterium]
MRELTRRTVTRGIGIAGLALALVAGGCGKPAEAPEDRSAVPVKAPEAKTTSPTGTTGETAAGSQANELQVRQARATLTPSMGAVYLTVVNRGTRSDRLLRVESAVAQAAATHESREVKGVMTMVEHPDGFEVPAGGTLELEPGGKHIMLVAPRMFAASGGTIPVTLHFEHAGTIQVQATVAPLGKGVESP